MSAAPEKERVNLKAVGGKGDAFPCGQHCGILHGSVVIVLKMLHKDILNQPRGFPSAISMTEIDFQIVSPLSYKTPPAPSNRSMS